MRSVEAHLLTELGPEAADGPLGVAGRSLVVREWVNTLAGVEGISVTFFVEVRSGGWARYRAGPQGGQENAMRVGRIPRWWA